MNVSDVTMNNVACGSPRIAEAERQTSHGDMIIPRNINQRVDVVGKLLLERENRSPCSKTDNRQLARTKLHDKELK